MIVYYITAFLIGFLGSIHCIGMCGSIIWILSSNIDKKNFFLYQINCNIGRLITYILIGIIVNFFGFLILDVLNKNIIFFLHILSGVILINIGLYINGTFQLLKHLEILGFKFWLILLPYTKKLIPIKNSLQCIIIGLLWGNLPCGLTYSIAIWTLDFNSVYKSALLMFFFGLGTLPILLITGTTVPILLRIKQNKHIRIIASTIIIVLGINTILKNII